MMQSPRIFKMYPNLQTPRKMDTVRRKVWENKPLKRINRTYERNKYFFWFVNVMGLFPLHIDTNGDVKFKFFSFLTFYSVAFLLCLVSITCFVTATIISNLSTKNFSFEETITYSSLFTLPLVFVLPICSIFEVKKIASFFTQLGHFQDLFENLTNKTYKVSFPWFSNLCLFTSIIVGATALKMWMLEFVVIMRDHDLNEPVHIFIMCTFMYVGILMTVYFYMWYMLNASVKNATNQVIVDIESLQWMPSKSLMSHYLLWLNIRQLCKKLGDVMSITYLYFCAALFLLTLPGIYVGCIAAVKGYTSHLMISCNPLLAVFAICETAHRTINKVGPEFEERLTFIFLSRKASAFDDKLNEFIDKVASNPPVISLGGVFNMDRGIFVPLLSSVVTYVIIILQFRMSMKE